MTRQKKTPASAPAETPLFCDWRDAIAWPSILPLWRELMSKGNEPHFVLFYGRRALGKRSLLAALAALYFCESREACARCEGCLSVMKNRQPELMWLGVEDGAASIKVDEASQLQEHLALLPSPLNWTETARAVYRQQALPRLAIIPDMDRLTEPAANRLLKTLEEPGQHVRILASTSRLGSMLPTILSRAVKWRVPEPDATTAKTWLIAHMANQGQTVAAAAVDEAMQSYGRAPGRMLHFFSEQGRQERHIEELLCQSLEQQDREMVLKTVESLAREYDLSIEAVVERAEHVLNRCYKEQLGLVAKTGDRPPSKLQRFTYRHEWRSILQDIRQLHRHGRRVALNTQLALEALVL